MGNIRKDLTGSQHGKLFVIERVANHGKKVAYLCRCDCGAYIEVESYKLITGHTKSCGCMRREVAKNRVMPTKEKSYNYQHGYAEKGSVHPLWNKWSSLKARCYNPSVQSYKFYGARGITVCDEWLASSQAFIEWALQNGWKPGLQIDRIDCNAGYSPDNCRFVSQQSNANNRRTNRLVSGKTVAELSRESGVNYSTLRLRLEAGYTLQEAVKHEDYRRSDKGKP